MAGPYSHTNDPSTSKEAAQRLVSSGSHSTQKRQVLEALEILDGATSGELADLMGVHWLTPARRLTELERENKVRKGAAKICRIKGTRCITWWLVR
jgi:hypothetical protein